MSSRTTVLEREADLATLTDAARCAAAGEGSVVLVPGEAGIGKSRLVAELPHVVPAGTRVLVGHCDDLATPRVLGPLRDLSGAVGADLARALRSPGEHDALFGAVHGELDWPGHATVLVVEDVHWADEATLDLLRWLVRRVAALPAVLVLTWRDDETDGAHPLRRLLAGVATAGTPVRRIDLRPLSPAAVASLAGGSPVPVEPATVMSLSGGNPFLVHEVLAAGPHRVPAGVSDLVLSRLQRLDPVSRDAVERLSVLPSAVDRDLVEALVDGGLARLQQAERHGLLVVEPLRVTFRHELTRRAVVDALATSRRTGLNAAVLRALEARADVDPARLVHHAREAGDGAAVVRHGPTAAAAARAGRAHRQAAEHLRAVLQHRDLVPAEDLPDLLQASAIECYTVGDQGRSALADQAESVWLRRAGAGPEASVALGVALRWLSRIAWWVGDRVQAEDAAREAVVVLGPLPDRGELALALSNSAQLAMLGEQMQEAARTAAEAVALARELDDRVVLTHALNNLGTARWALGDEAGRRLVEESRDVALEAGLSEHASRAWCNLVWHLLMTLRPDDAARELEAAIEHAEGTEQVVFWKYLHVERGMVALTGARWAAATADARVALDATNPLRCAALQVVGRVAVRTGVGTVDAVVEECWSLAVGLGELQRTAPAGGLVCEAAWLRGDLDRVREVAGLVHDEARRLGSVAWGLEAAHWLALAGRPVPETDLASSTHPWAASARGDWAGAARGWAAAGYPYETAAALVRTGHEPSTRRGLAALDSLGAAPLADRTRADLRRLGATGVPRGPSAATRADPTGLTPRQVEVLALLDDGLSNQAIAERLVLSVRTVDHHVSDLLRKLSVETRTEAPARARQLGWTR